MGRCPNCGAAHDTEYCPMCGQHRDAARLQPFRKLAVETAAEALSLDSRVTRTLRLLLFHPGEATVRYVAGRRQSYVPPLRLYLVVSAVAIFVMAAGGLVSLELMLEDEDQEVRQFVESRGGDLGDPLFYERFEARLGTVLSIVSMLTPVFLALGLKALYPRFLLHAHFVFALHAWTAVMIVAPPLLAVARLHQDVATVLLALFVFVYLFLAQRRVYDGKALALGLKYAAIVVVVLITTGVVRGATFFLTILLASEG